MKKLILALLLGITPLMATETTDPFGPTLDLLNKTIATQQQELLQAVPVAKNEKFQAELEKVQLVYKKVLENSIENLNNQVKVVQALSPILKGISTQPESLAAAQEQMTRLQATFTECQQVQRRCESSIKILHDRITDLTSQNIPSSSPENWWDQFGTSFGSSS